MNRFKFLVIALFFISIAVQAAPNVEAPANQQSMLEQMEVIRLDLEDRLATDNSDLAFETLAQHVRLMDALSGNATEQQGDKITERSIGYTCEEPCVLARQQAYVICAQYYTGSAYYQCIQATNMNYQRCLKAKGCLG